MRCGFFVPAQCRRAWVPCKRSAPLAGRIRIRPDAPCASAVGPGSDTRGEVLNWAVTTDSSHTAEGPTLATTKEAKERTPKKAAEHTSPQTRQTAGPKNKKP